MGLSSILHGTVHTVEVQPRYVTRGLYMIHEGHPSPEGAILEKKIST